jgi:hypothetical protein
MFTRDRLFELLRDADGKGGGEAGEDDTSEVDEGEGDEEDTSATDAAAGADSEAGEGEEEEEETEAEAETEEEPKPKQEPWFTKRIGALTKQKNDALRQAETLQKQLESVATRLGIPVEQLVGQQQEQLSQSQDQLQDQTQLQAQPKKYYTEEEALQMANQVASERGFTEQCNQAYTQGKEEFKGEFDASLQALHSQLGGLPRDFLEAALETGVAHNVIHELGRDLDKAMEILSLPPGAKRAIAVSNFAAKFKRSKKTSNAPPPIQQRVGGRSSPKPSLDDKDLPIDRWMEERKRQVGSTARQ